MIYTGNGRFGCTRSSLRNIARNCNKKQLECFPDHNVQEQFSDPFGLDDLLKFTIKKYIYEAKTDEERELYKALQHLCELGFVSTVIKNDELCFQITELGKESYLVDAASYFEAGIA